MSGRPLNHHPPRWFGVSVLLLGLSLGAALIAETETLAQWLLPTGLLILLMIAAGLRWACFNPRR